MQGAYVGATRPATKKALRDAIAADPSRVTFEATSLFGDEYDGPADGLPDGVTVYVTGPDPYRRRNWYANVSRGKDGRLTVR